MCRDGAQSGPSHFSPLNAPFLCPLHLSKAQIPSKSGQITRKAQYSRLLQNWHAPCNKQYISSFGGPGTGRPGEPLFYLQHRRFWGPRYRQAGHPPFIRSTPFGDPGTGRPGYPLFYSCSFTCTRQRPASSAPAHSPCRGRAATTVNNKPSLLCCTRQLTGLPCRLSCPC